MSGYILSCLLMLVFNINLSCCQDVCVKYGNTEVCGPNSTWAVALPQVTTTHNFDSPLSSTFTLSYSLHLSNGSKILLCAYSYSYPSTNCFNYTGSNCIGCINSLAASKNVTAIFKIPDIDESKDNSRIAYVFAANSIDVFIHGLNVQECPKDVGNAVASTLVDPCGYGCTSTFSCSQGYENDSPETLYQCTATAEWNSTGPICLPGCEECDCCTKQETAAITITVIGSIFVAVEIGIAIYSCNNKPGVEHANLLFAAFGVCAVAWITSVIVLFVVKGNCTCTVDGAGNCTCMAAGTGDCTCPAYIAGATIGGISIAGMAVSIGIHIWAITKNEPEAKSTPGISMEK